VWLRTVSGQAWETINILVEKETVTAIIIEDSIRPKDPGCTSERAACELADYKTQVPGLSCSLPA